MAKQPTEQQLRAGERMKQAAEDKGFNAYDVARHLGIRPPTVYRWFRGSRPGQEMLEAFAALVGRSVSDFWLEREQGASLQQWLLEFADLIASGVSPDAAIDRIAGEAGVSGETMSPAERTTLRGSGDAMREVLQARAGGHWESLTPAQRAAVLNLIESLAAANSPKSTADEAGS